MNTLMVVEYLLRGVGDARLPLITCPLNQLQGVGDGLYLRRVVGGAPSYWLRQIAATRLNITRSDIKKTIKYFPII